jgi:hypothetical protein
MRMVFSSNDTGLRAGQDVPYLRSLPQRINHPHLISVKLEACYQTLTRRRSEFRLRRHASLPQAGLASRAAIQRRLDPARLLPQALG